MKREAVSTHFHDPQRIISQTCLRKSHELGKVGRGDFIAAIESPLYH
jgi:hypothetical protein